jgi:antitoxin component YwqK of YwqJK toxin-antitoxin module
MRRVPAKSLSYPGDGLYYLDGVPFAGVAYFPKPDGWVEGETEYRDGLRWGLVREWYRSGALAYEASFFRDAVHGRKREWHENGQLASDGGYEYGITVWEKKWDEQGRPIDDYRVRETDPDYKTIQHHRRVYGTANASEDPGGSSPP